MPKTDLLQGTLDLLILKILTLGPNHGWGIANRIRQISREGLNASQGSLYPALHRLELSGDVKSEMTASENNRRARIYTLTGIIQWIVLWPLVTDGRLYLLYFAIKMAGAIGLFSITALLALPGERLERMQAKRGFWSALNIACGLTILFGAALMRTVAKGS